MWPGLQPIDSSNHVDSTVSTLLNQEDIAADRRVFTAALDFHDCDEHRGVATQRGAAQQLLCRDVKDRIYDNI